MGHATVVMAVGLPHTYNMMVTMEGLCMTVTAGATGAIVLPVLTVSVKKIPQLAQSCKSWIIFFGPGRLVQSWINILAVFVGLIFNIIRGPYC